MAFPIPNQVFAQSTIDEVHTLTCNGLDITPNKVVVSPIVLCNKFQCALLSADFDGFKKGDIKHFVIKFKTISMQGELYRNAGKFEANADNTIDMAKCPIYRNFTMPADTQFSDLELEICNADGAPIAGDPSWGNSYFTIHIRHNPEILQNEWLDSIKIANENTGQSAASVSAAVGLVHQAVLDQKASQDLTKLAVDQCKQANNLIKSSVDSCVAATGLVKTAVEECKVELSARLVDVSGACADIKDATDAHKASAEASATQLKASIDAHKASAELSATAIKDATDAHKASAELSATAIKDATDACKDELSAKLVDVSAACGDISTQVVAAKSMSIVNTAQLKASTDAVNVSINAFKDANDASMQAHQAVSQQISDKTRYKLLY